MKQYSFQWLKRCKYERVMEGYITECELQGLYTAQNEMSTHTGFHHWFLLITSSELNTKQNKVIYFLLWSHKLQEKKSK